jgi:hypothetical protein
MRPLTRQSVGASADILSSGGERWVVSKLLTLEKQFPLYDLLIQRQPNFNEDGLLTYYLRSHPTKDKSEFARRWEARFRRRL